VQLLSSNGALDEKAFLVWWTGRSPSGTTVFVPVAPGDTPRPCRMMMHGQIVLWSSMRQVACVVAGGAHRNETAVPSAICQIHQTTESFSSSAAITERSDSAVNEP